MKLAVKDIVKPSGIGRTRTWNDELAGTIRDIDKKTGSVFVIWHGTCVEDEMEPDELTKVGENTEIPPTWKVLKVNVSTPAPSF
jgi:hypothetical protein